MTFFPDQESWQLRKGCTGVKEDEAEFEEELYTAGNMAVWSQGSSTQASSVYKAFTVDSPVQQVGYRKSKIPVFDLFQESVKVF